MRALAALLPADLTRLVTDEAVLVVAGTGWATIDQPGARTMPATLVRFALPR